MKMKWLSEVNIQAIKRLKTAVDLFQFLANVSLLIQEALQFQLTGEELVGNKLCVGVSL